MGIGVALAGSIVAAVMFFVIMVTPLTGDSIAKINDAKSIGSDVESTIFKTNIQIVEINATAGTDEVDFVIENTGMEKLWDFENFEVIIRYDADIGGISTPTTERLVYDASDSFSTTISGVKHSFPDSDIDKGLWTDLLNGDGDLELYDEIDEPTRSDVDYISSTLLNIVTTKDTAIFGLEDIDDPFSEQNHFVAYTYQKDSGGGNQIDVIVELLEGNDLIASWTHNNIGTGFTLANQTLTSTQANSITDYTDLRLNVTGVCGPCVGGDHTLDVSWARLTVPEKDCIKTNLLATEWMVGILSDDVIDPNIINSNEKAKMCARLSNDVFTGGTVQVFIATDLGASAQGFTSAP